MVYNIKILKIQGLYQFVTIDKVMQQLGSIHKVISMMQREDADNWKIIHNVVLCIQTIKLTLQLLQVIKIHIFKVN